MIILSQRNAVNVTQRVKLVPPGLPARAAMKPRNLESKTLDKLTAPARLAIMRIVLMFVENATIRASHA